MKKQFIVPLAIISTMSIAGLASGAIISWSSSSAPVEGTGGEFLSAGLFDNSGTVVLAENAGGDAGVFDGISFTYDGVITKQLEKRYATVHAGNLLSRAFRYNAAQGAQTLVISDLDINQEYRIQALVFDGRASLSGRAVQFDGQNMGVYANGMTGYHGEGLLVTGVFTADGTTQTFTTENFSDDTYGNGVSAQLNAIAVHAIPEPSTLGMIGLMGAGLMFVRRKLWF